MASVEPGALIDSLTARTIGSEVIERGKDSALIRAVSSTTNTDGSLSFRTNHITLLENGLHYFSDGEWNVSRDLVEPFPNGAVARYGPNKAIFSSELFSEAVFDIETSEGQRIRGGVRSIQLTDVKTGQTAVLGTVKRGARGEIIPPNQVVYRSGFDGIEADVLLVWRHDSISQNVILLAKPSLPEGLDPATTRLEVVSELIECPEPFITSCERKDGVCDDVVIGLGSLAAVRGQAFSVAGDKGLVLTGGRVLDDPGVYVAKEFRPSDDGRKFIIESVGWTEIQPHLAGLKTAAVLQPAKPRDEQAAASSRWPPIVTHSAAKEPLHVAAAPYQRDGFLVDIDLSGSVSSYNFLSGSTYYIAQSFYIAGTATTTFNAGCVLKYGNDAWLILHCPVATPPTGQLMPVLTSKDDDDYGATIPASTHAPTHMAAKAIWMYYVDQTQTELNNLRIRWAKKAIQLDAYVGNGVNHKVKDTLLQKCVTGIHAEIPDGSLTLVNVRKCDVTTPLYCNCDGSIGSMTDDCGPFYNVANFQGLTQAETISNVPDTMGAVGPDHFMTILNGSADVAHSVAVYDKRTGMRLTPPTQAKDFFLAPANHMADARIIYDLLSHRWIACSIHQNSPIYLAVSKTHNPVGTGGSGWVADNWNRYQVQIPSCYFPDFPKLAVDGNGIYISTFGCPTAGQVSTTIYCLAKQQFLDNSAPLGIVPFQLNGPLGDIHIFPASNFDPIAADGKVWCLYYNGGSILYRSFQWNQGPGNAPEWDAANQWRSLSLPPHGGSFCDLISGAASLPYQKTNSTSQVARVDLGRVGSRLTMATAKTIADSQYIWTCLNAGVTQSGIGTCIPFSSADRAAVAWYKMSVTSSLSIVDWQRIYDSAPEKPTSYYMPSIAVNKYGDVLVGCSGSNKDRYVGAYFAGRRASGTVHYPTPYFEGKALVTSPTGRVFWGDYSATTLDPDGVAFWTIQEYAETPSLTYDIPKEFGTRIGAFAP